MEFDQSILINRYNLTSKLYDRVRDTLEECIEKIKNADMRRLSYQENLALIGVIGEMYPLLAVKEGWLEMAATALNDIKNSLESLKMNRLGLHEGLANAAYFTTVLFQNSGFFKNALDSMNDILLKSVMKQIEIMEQNKNSFLVNSWFDAVSGLSGIGYYLLFSNKFSPENAKVFCIEQIESFLIGLAGYEKMNGYDIPGWYSRKELENAHIGLTQVHVNNSLSHGAAGVLSFLTKAFEYGIVQEGQQKAINFIVMEMIRSHQGDWAVDYFIRNESIDSASKLKPGYAGCEQRLSWCCGALSELAVLQAAACALKKPELETQIRKQMILIANRDIKKYHLTSPIICHGYAGTAVLFYQLYEHTGLTELKIKGNQLVECMVNLYDKNSKYGFQDTIVGMSEDDMVSDKLDFLEGSGGCSMTLLMLLKEHVNFVTLLML